jgi:glycerol kinase
MTARYVMSIDQGTTSTRAILFDQGGRLVSVAQIEQRQYFPQPGWIEHDAGEIWRNVVHTITRALADAGAGPSDIAAVGVANQRETIVVWDRRTGQPVRNAIVWQDTRTDALIEELAARPDAALVPERSGLPLASYFSASRLRWILAETPGLRERAEAGEVLVGTMESWVIWKLTGGPDGGRHITEPTNASRTLLMNIDTLDWDPQLLAFFDIPAQILPEICPSMHRYGRCTGPLAGVPITAALGDQQAALFGQTCFTAGEAKCTYGTGSFLLVNTGNERVRSSHGMLGTIAYQLAGERPVYALEGSIATTGSLVQWFRDGLGLIQSAAEIETLAATVENNGGCYVVPAFYGLFAPRWRPEARGVIAGLTSYITKGHLARAVLEATGWQSREVLDAVNADTGRPITELRVDGGMTADNLLMQFVADVLDLRVVRPMVLETVALGAAYAAGLSVGYWLDLRDLRRNWHRAAEWLPQMPAAHREAEYANWRRAVELTLNWTQKSPQSDGVR